MADSPEFPLPSAPPPADHRKKKTRDLPNLSDCHCCNRRINTTNPKNRLRILTSHWRIVLLCNSCYNLVESSQYCSYCLTGVSSSSSVDTFFDCKKCHRRIHRTCVSKFSLGPGNGGDFSVCFDCCVPELLENEYNRVRRTKKKVKVCGDSASLGSSRVCDSQDNGKSLEETVNEANVAAWKKIVWAGEAKEKAATKAVVARRAVELASCALSFVAVDKGCERGDLAVEDDAQLAIQLHRAMNSSPRIARNLCLMNTDCTNVPKLRKSTNAGVGGDANNMNSDSLSYRELNGSCLAETRQDCVQRTCGIQDEKCGDSNGCLITYSRRGRAPQDGRCKEEPDNFFFRMYARRLSRVERHNNTERAHCFKTHSRRRCAISLCKDKLQYGGFNIEHGIITSAVSLNCCEKSRAFANAS